MYTDCYSYAPKFEITYNSIKTNLPISVKFNNLLLHWKNSTIYLQLYTTHHHHYYMQFQIAQNNF